MQTSTDICNAEKPVNHEFFYRKGFSDAWI